MSVIRSACEEPWLTSFFLNPISKAKSVVAWLIASTWLNMFILPDVDCGWWTCVCVSQDAGRECVVAFVLLQHSDMGPRKDLPGL